VAAELIEEAELLSETGLIATPADLSHATRPPIHLEREAQVTATVPAAPAPTLPSGAPDAPPVVPVNGAAPAPARTVRDPEQALTELDRALSDSPDDATILLARAGLLSTLGNYAGLGDLERPAPSEHGEALTALAGAMRRACGVKRPPSCGRDWMPRGPPPGTISAKPQSPGRPGGAPPERAAELEPAHAKSYYGQARA
jgi:hypothetical protein